MSRFATYEQYAIQVGFGYPVCWMDIRSWDDPASIEGILDELDDLREQNTNNTYRLVQRQIDEEVIA